MKLLFTLAFVCGATGGASAQNSGQAEVAAQGYYLGIEPRPLSMTSGAAVKFQEFLPSFGLLSGSFEAYRSEGGLHSGDNYLEASGLRWKGLRWKVTAGDFRSPGSLLPNPFYHIYLPELSGRGIRLEAGNSTREYSFFLGGETVQAGPRIPFRADVPQRTLGMSVRQKFGKLETGVRWLHLSSTAAEIEGNPGYFPAGRDFTSADNLTGYSALKLGEHFRWYGEATVARAVTASGRPSGSPFSYLFGPSYDSPMFTLRLNYSKLSENYQPVVGHWVGDRKGPFGEARFRPWQRLELFASTSRYENADPRSREVTSIGSRSSSTGVSLQLPLGFNAAVQLSTIRLHTVDPRTDLTTRADNRQWSGSVSKHIFHQTLRFTFREFKLNFNQEPYRQKSREFEDIVQIKRVSFGIGIRQQQQIATERRDSLYIRGSAQITLGRLTAYGNFENGKDLVNQTLFATTLATTTVAGASIRLSRRWSASAEAFRNHFLTELNRTNAFVLATQGIGVDPVLSRFRQWSVLVRVTRNFTWGPALPGAGNMANFAARAMPLTGSITGSVHVLVGDKLEPAAAVAVSLESGRTVTTNTSGKYLFEEVPEGTHEIRLNLEQLPAEYNPGPNAKKNITVTPRRAVRADLDVQSLSGLQGAVVARPGSEFESLENILVRLAPGGGYTTTLPDGSFAFYNLPPGDYNVEIAPDTLPPSSRLPDPLPRPVTVRSGVLPPPVRFELERSTAPAKPTRKVLDIQIGPGNPRMLP